MVKAYDGLGSMRVHEGLLGRACEVFFKVCAGLLRRVWQGL